MHPVIPAGAPLRVVLEHRVAPKRAGISLEAHLAEPVYVYDRMALPAGARVTGHVAAVERIPLGRRLVALLSGNLTPLRRVRAQFEEILLADGTGIPLHTAMVTGTPCLVSVSKNDIRGGPAKTRRLFTYLLNMLPYRRQSWRAGTRFAPVLTDPVRAPECRECRVESGASDQLSARLVGQLTSASAQRGMPVEAVVTRPVFSASHELLIPEGSRLHGEILKVSPARWLHRNGKLLFTFRAIETPRSVHAVQGYLEGVQTDFASHLELDSEGAAHISNPKTRWIVPAVSAVVAGLSFHQDFNSQGVPDADSAGRAESGIMGLGVIGAAVAQVSRPVASGFAVYGAAWSIYRAFIARGKDVVLPANTAITVALGARGGAAPAQ